MIYLVLSDMNVKLATCENQGMQYSKQSFLFKLFLELLSLTFLTIFAHLWFSLLRDYFCTVFSA